MEVLSKTNIDQITSRVNSDREFTIASENLDSGFLIEVCGKRHLFKFNFGQLTYRGEYSIYASSDFAIRFSDPSWLQMVSSSPPPGFQSLVALLVTQPDFRCEGDMTAFSQCLHALNRFFEIIRSFCSQGRMDSNSPADKVINRDPSIITGHYMDVSGEDGSACRVFYEESGTGIPLLLLHTANSDARQYHDVLTDVEIAESWHMFAFDLPYHGRSTPPSGWWQRKYSLSETSYDNWCINFIRAAIKSPCAVIGCSMGAAMAVHLAAKYPDWILGIVALEAPYRWSGRRNAFLVHPKVNQAAFNPSFAYSLMNPSSPEVYRKKAWWYYSQGGFGVYDGDLAFYCEEWDAGNIAGKIDTKRCPVHLLTGEYDYSCTPTSSKKLADEISGSHFHIMDSLGHFPMTENPDLFRKYLIPVLDELKQTIALRVNGIA